MTPAAIADLLEPYLAPYLAPYLVGSTSLPSALYDQLALYLDLLLKWNARTNLTAVRSPEEIVQRHFGESLFAGLHLPPSATLLDFGSGAGFPGLPIQLLHPGMAVTLGESQNKKASFLREVVRTLALPTQVWAGRVEAMPAGTRFDAVTLRAVDRMELAIAAAAPLAGQHLVLLTTATQPAPQLDHVAATFVATADLPIPRSHDGRLRIYQRTNSQ